MTNFPYFNNSFEDGAYLTSFSDFLDPYKVWVPSGWSYTYLDYYSTTNRNLMESEWSSSWSSSGVYSFMMRFNSGTTWREGFDQIVFNYPNLECPADACWVTIDYNVTHASSNFELTFGVQNSILSQNGSGSIQTSSTGSGSKVANSATFKTSSATIGFIIALLPTSDTTDDCTIHIDNIGTTNAVSDNTSTRLEVGNTILDTNIDTRIVASNFNATLETVTLTVTPPWGGSTAYNDLNSGTITMSHTFSSGNIMWYTFDYAVSEFNGDVWCDVDNHDAWVETKVHYLSPSGNDSNSGLTKYDAYRTFDYLANNISDGEYANINYGGYNDEPSPIGDVFPLNTGTSGITYDFSDFFNEGMDTIAYVGAPSKFLRDHTFTGFGQYYVTYISGNRVCVGMDSATNNIVTTTWDTFSSDSGVSIFVDSAPTNMSVYAGQNIILDDGYYVEIVEIVTSPSRQALLRLYDGVTLLDTSVVQEYGTYVYEDTSHPSGEDIPIVAIDFGDFIISTEVTVAFIDGIWQCSDYSISW